jgi:hypothetical protein
MTVAMVPDHNPEGTGDGEGAQPPIAQPAHAEVKERLTASQVVDARRRANNGDSVLRMARELKVGASALQSAVMGKSWRHLNLEAPPRPVRPSVSSRLSPAECHSLARRVADGEALRSAAKTVGVAKETLIRAFAHQFIRDMKESGGVDAPCPGEEIEPTSYQRGGGNS